MYCLASNNMKECDLIKYYFSRWIFINSVNGLFSTKMLCAYAGKFERFKIERHICKIPLRKDYIRFFERNRTLHPASHALTPFFHKRLPAWSRQSNLQLNTQLTIRASILIERHILRVRTITFHYCYTTAPSSCRIDFL